MQRRHVLPGIVLALLALLAWLVFPLYGFASHQFGLARTPWGWKELPAPPPPAGQARADLVLERWRARIGAPSLAAAVYKDGELAWSGASGWADVDSRTPASPQTYYRAGSTSKAITATLFARLADRGVVDAFAPVGRYLPAPPNRDWEELSLRQLASHTAGLVGYEENGDWIGLYRSMALQTHFDDPRDALSVFDHNKLLFAPGEGYHYSSYDIVLLSAVIEAAADRPLLDLVTEEVTAPLKLHSLGADSLRAPPGPLATFYDRKDSRVRPWRPVDLSHKLAGGGFLATPEQLARIGSAWLDEDFIAPATRELFWTPVVLADGTVNEEDYAMGWRRKTWEIPGIGEVENLNHGGISKGSQCWLMVVPADRLSLAACMNALTDEFFEFADVSRELLPLFTPPRAGRE